MKIVKRKIELGSARVIQSGSEHVTILELTVWRDTYEEHYKLLLAPWQLSTLMKDIWEAWKKDAQEVENRRKHFETQMKGE